MQFIKTDRAPAAIGPYSQAVKTEVKEMIFVSGQIPLDPKTMKLVSEDIEAQTKQVMVNLAAVLKQAGSGLEKIVKTTIFLTDLSQFNAVNKCYQEALGKHRPARACVEVSRLPKDVKIEIEAIAHS